jgi:hypothetical protein
MCIQIDLVDIDLLRPHEETDQEYVKILTEKISRDKILRRPLLIDSEETIILDGHHRYEALKRLGIRKVPVIKIRYKDDEHIKIDKWIRIYMIDVAVKGIRLPQRSTRHITFLKKIILPTSLRLLI